MKGTIIILIIALMGFIGLEANGQSSIDLTFNHQLSTRVAANIDLSISSFNTVDESSEQNHMTLAPNFTSSGGLSYQLTKRLYGIINYQLLKEPMMQVENEPIDQGYFIFDTGIAYDIGQLQISLSLGRPHKVAWHEEQFDLAYTIFDEPDLIPETPSFRQRIQARLSIAIML